MLENISSALGRATSIRKTSSDEFDGISLVDIMPGTATSAPGAARSTRTTSSGEFDEIEHADAQPASVQDLRNIHAVHVANTYSHILPPYSITGATKDLLTTTCHPDTPEGKAKQAAHEAFLLEQERNYVLSNPYFPIGGQIDVSLPPPIDRRDLHVVHQNRNTIEVPVYMGHKCDYTCPQVHESIRDKLMRKAGKYKKKLGAFDAKNLF